MISKDLHDGGLFVRAIYISPTEIVECGKPVNYAR